MSEWASCRRAGMATIRQPLDRLIGQPQEHQHNAAFGGARAASARSAAEGRSASFEFRRVELCRLTEAAALVGVPYERARRWSERGLVTSAKKVAGTGWVVNVEDLRCVAALHAGH